jgi:hypothetical protein
MAWDKQVTNPRKMDLEMVDRFMILTTTFETLRGVVAATCSLKSD